MFFLTQFLFFFFLNALDFLFENLNQFIVADASALVIRVRFEFGEDALEIALGLVEHLVPARPLQHRSPLGNFQMAFKTPVIFELALSFEHRCIANAKVWLRVG